VFGIYLTQRLKDVAGLNKKGTDDFISPCLFYL